MVLLAGIAPAVQAARITASVTQQITFASSANFTITPLGTSPIAFTDTGSPTGPNFVQTTLFAQGIPYSTGPDVFGFYATAQIDLTAGPGTSFNNARAYATSGVVRIENTSNTDQSINFINSLPFSAEAIGPDTAFVELKTYLEKFNSQTQMWESITSALIFGLNQGDAPLSCSAQCGGLAGTTIAANSYADFRVYAGLRAIASQVGSGTTPDPIPEPATTMLCGVALAAGTARHLVRRRFAGRRDCATR